MGAKTTDEGKVLASIVRGLEKLTDEERARVLRYLVDKFGDGK